jgi:hypothetical protein
VSSYEILATHEEKDQLIAAAKHFNSALDKIDIPKNQAQELIISELIREENLAALGSVALEKDQKIAENFENISSIIQLSEKEIKRSHLGPEKIIEEIKEFFQENATKHLSLAEIPEIASNFSRKFTNDKSR